MERTSDSNHVPAWTAQQRKEIIDWVGQNYDGEVSRVFEEMIADRQQLTFEEVQRVAWQAHAQVHQSDFEQVAAMNNVRMGVNSFLPSIGVQKGFGD